MKLIILNGFTFLKWCDCRCSQTSFMVQVGVQPISVLVPFTVTDSNLLLTLLVFSTNWTVHMIDYIFSLLQYFCWQMLASRFCSVQSHWRCWFDWGENMEYISWVEGIIRHRIYCSLSMTAWCYLAMITFYIFLWLFFRSVCLLLRMTCLLYTSRCV